MVHGEMKGIEDAHSYFTAVANLFNYLSATLINSSPLANFRCIIEILTKNYKWHFHCQISILVPEIFN